MVALRKTKATTGKWLAGAFSGDVLSGCLGRRRNRSDVVDSIETGGSNLSGRSSPLSSSGCATEYDQYCACSPTGGVHHHFRCDFYRRLFGHGNIDSYRNNRDALVKFGREVRRIAAAEHLRYEILPASDEGLLLYLQRPRFFREPPVGCNALVVPLDEEPWSSGRFSYRVTVEKKGDEPSSYGFVAPLPPHR